MLRRNGGIDPIGILILPSEPEKLSSLNFDIGSEIHTFESLLGGTSKESTQQHP